MKQSNWIYFGGGIMGFTLYYLLTSFLWNLLFSGDFGGYLMLAAGAYFCLAWLRFQWHKPERFFHNLRPDLKLSSRDKAWWKFHWRFNWVMGAGDMLFFLLIVMIFEKQGPLMAAAMFLGALVVLFPLYLSIWGSFHPSHLRWRFRRLPFFRKKPSREGLRRIAVTCMGGICAVIPTIFLLFG